MNKKIISCVLGVTMVLIYCTMAGLLVFSSVFDKQFSFTVRVICGSIFFVYGVFRAYRIIVDYNEK